jgi:hypothetical protein
MKWSHRLQNCVPSTDPIMTSELKMSAEVLLNVDHRLYFSKMSLWWTHAVHPTTPCYQVKLHYPTDPTVGPPTLHLPSLLHNGRLKYIHSFWRTLYVGQTGRTFRSRYKEHIREIKPNGSTSKYAQHVLDTAHNYDDIEVTMKILQIAK